MPRSLSLVFRVMALGVVMFGAENAEAKPPKKETVASAPPFDKSAAMQSLASVDLARCKVPGGPRGDGHVIVSFTPKGEAAKAEVDQGVFVGSKVQKCIEAKFKGVAVPAFAGEGVTVGKKFSLL